MLEKNSPGVIIDLQSFSRMTLRISSEPAPAGAYPTGRIQRGLVLVDDGQELCEEAVGFGVPILKYGLRTVFPGELELFAGDNGSANVLHARFKMNLEEKIGRPGSRTLDNPILYGAKNVLAALIRCLPSIRGLLTHTSNLVRHWFSLETSYTPIDNYTYITMTYIAEARTGRIKVSLKEYAPKPPGITEVIVMNEQGAHFFDQYQDSDGNSLLGEQIGCWDQVFAQRAAFISHSQDVSFSIPQVSGAKLYRGRELVGSRLAWAGFGYSFPPTLEQFSYEISLNRPA